MDSTLNREASFRQAVDASLAGLEDYFQKSLEKLERAVTDCFLRRDAKLESQMKKLRLTSTPTLSRLQAYSPASALSSPMSLKPRPVAKHKDPTCKVPNTTYDINSSVHDHPPSVIPSSVMASSSSFCTRPPIRLEFPSFGDSCETAEVLNFIEQCENFLEIRPLPSLELIGTLSTVLKGPAQSWWKAEKAKRFIMADGTIHQSKDLQKLHYQWHGQECTLDTYILKNTHLALPLIAGLDFLTATGTVLEVGQGRYGLRSSKRYTYYPFLPSQIPAGPTTQPGQAHFLTAAKLNLYYALPPTGRVPELMSFTPEISQWDTDNQEELLKLITTWPRTTSNILGRTSVVQHKITLTDDIPLKSRAYRVSPIKKEIIEEQVDQMLQDDIIEPSF
ncbi:hypothetical protein M9458_051269 [Cirrhinus mrigala]|uniref:Uncharacterized protein n=1 Tax=Cirrhinus mrigala TaxID=683832 RepID=A0ABD0MWQ9_CIRMR